MNSILKKTLLAMSVAAAASVNASTIVGNNDAVSAFTTKKWPLVSAEGLGISETLDIGNNADEVPVRISLDGNFLTGDVVVVTITGATIESSASAALTVTGGTGAFARLGGSVADGTVTFRATGPGNAPVLELSGITLEEVGSVVSVAANVLVDGNSVDAVAATPVAAIGSEIKIGAGDTTLNGVIDVAKQRKQFTNEGVTDSFTVDVNAGADKLGVTLGTASIAVTGADFDFLNDGDGDLDDTSYELDSLVEDASETTFEGNTLTVISSSAVTAGDNAFGMTFTVDGVEDEDAQQLSAQSFSADVNVAYSYGGTNRTANQDGISVGAWKLSGANANIAYMPYGAGISQIIYVSNDGNVTGDIELTAFDDEGESYGPVTLSQAATAGTVTSLAQSIRTALEAEGFDGTGRLDMTLVINSPGDDIEVFSAYNVRGNRLAVPVSVTN